MASSLNVVQLIGRTGGEPAMRYTAAGQAVTTFSLATDRRGSKSDEPSGPDWHRIVAFAKLGEFCNAYLTKGCLIGVSSDLCCLAACRSPVPWSGRGRCDGLGSTATDRVEGPAIVCAAARQHALLGA